ncbi:MAG: CHASE domain-containing protein [Bdellovibrionaceae bacterium]|nr:CHASE domain-containing protein [Pseudobdellovibrionaceae bacterium]
MPEATILKYERERMLLSPAVVFVLCSLFTVLAWFVASLLSTAENSARFDRSALSLHYAFKNRMNVYTNALVYTRNLFQLKPDLSADEFRQFVRGMNLKAEYPGITVMGYVRRYSRAQLLQTLPRLPENARAVLDVAKDDYDVVVYAESLVEQAGNALGMDLSTSLPRYEAMNRAATLGLPVATDKVTRISVPESADAGAIFLVFSPHYRQGVKLDTPEERREALIGFVYAGFRAPVLFGNLAQDAKMQDSKLILRVYDGAEMRPEELVYAKGDLQDAGEFRTTIKLRAAEHDWAIDFMGTKDFAPPYSRYLPLMVLFMGIVLTFAVTLWARKGQRFAAKLQEDIEIRHLTEAQLQEEKRIVELTSTIGTTLKAEQDLESIVQMVTDVATDLTGAKFGAFFYNLLDAKGDTMTLYVLSGAKISDFARFGMPRNTEVFRTSFEGRGMMRVHDITKDPRYGRNAPLHGMPEGHLPVRSYLSAPVMSKNGKVLGSLLFGHPEAGVFTARSEAILKSLAIQAGIAMDNANLYRELTLARAQADSANRAKSLFLANVSHEIRTPLGIMLGFAELTSEHKTDPARVDENMKKILRNGRELTRIIGEVLDLSKIEANALLIENSAIPLMPFLTEMRNEWGLLIQAKKLGFEFEIEGVLPAEIRTDSTRLTQILTNLLNNALKFTESGAIRVRVSVAESQIDFEIEDTGLGISPENQQQLFKTFSQGDSSITRRFGGSGLGLALSKQLAIALGGDLRLGRSQLGQGSLFILTLPIRQEAGVAIDVVGSRPGVTATDLTGIKVLLVEDSIDNQQLISTFLEKANATVVTADNGEEGVTEALRTHYDVVLMDIQMPVLDGYGAYEKLRGAGYDRPVIALTAHALIEEKDKAFSMGFYDYLTKPVNRKALIIAIGQAAFFGGRGADANP